MTVGKEYIYTPFVGIVIMIYFFVFMWHTDIMSLYKMGDVEYSISPPTVSSLPALFHVSKEISSPNYPGCSYKTVF